MSFWDRIRTMTLDISAPLERLLSAFLGVLPTLLIFIAVVLGGVILAPIAAKVVHALVRRSGIETLLERLGAPRLLYRIGYRHGTATLLGTVARLAIYLVTALIAADVVGMTQVANGLDVIIGYLPRVAVAVFFLMIGVWAADMARSVVSGVAKGAQGNVIGTVIYYGVVAITVALVADQLGLQTSLINHIIVLVIAGTVFAASLAAGLSARPTLSNMFARNYVVQLYPRGDTVKIDGVEGIVKSHAPTALVVVGDGETFNIPYTRFMESTVATAGDARPVRADGVTEDNDD